MLRFSIKKFKCEYMEQFHRKMFGRVFTFFTFFKMAESAYMNLRLKTSIYVFFNRRKGIDIL